MDSILKLVTGQWTLYIIWILSLEGPKRFGELKRSVPGISAKVLTERLRHLEHYNLLIRDVKPTRPPEVTYSLSPRGNELIELLNPLYNLACQWLKEDESESCQAGLLSSEAKSETSS